LTNAPITLCFTIAGL